MRTTLWHYLLAALAGTGIALLALWWGVRLWCARPVRRGAAHEAADGAARDAREDYPPQDWGRRRLP